MSARTRKPKLGARIAASRLQRGLSQGEVARRAGLNPAYVSRIETDDVHPTVATALRIAAGLGVSLDDLVGPLPAERRGKPCPVSGSGHCLMDLVVTRSGAGRARSRETVTPRQLRLVRGFVDVVQRSDPERLRFLEVLVGEVLADRTQGRS